MSRGQHQALSSVSDFDSFYSRPDPWGLRRVKFRDRALRRAIAPHVAGQIVLELGCGEAHLTRAIFHDAKRVSGIDISHVAIARAKMQNLSNATFAVEDMKTIPFGGFDVIAAIEVLNYLSEEERAAFFARIAAEGSGTFIMATAITGGKYFTHDAVLRHAHSAGLSLLSRSNIFPEFGPGWLAQRLRSVFVRLPFADHLLGFLPDGWVQKRVYVFRSPDRGLSDGTMSEHDDDLLRQRVLKPWADRKPRRRTPALAISSALSPRSPGG